MHITFVGALRAHLNKRHDEIEVPEEFTIGDLIKALSAKHGDIVEYYLLDAGRRFRSNVVILVDGVRLDLTKGLDTVLTGSKRTEVVVMEAVGGGLGCAARHLIVHIIRTELYSGAL